MGVQSFHINEVLKKIFKGEGGHDGQFPYLKRFLGKVDTPMHTIMLVMLRTSCKTQKNYIHVN